MTPATRREYAAAMAGSPLSREDAWQRGVEFLFERLAVRWEIADAEPITRQKELLGRYRFAAPGGAPAGSATRCARTWPSTSPISSRRERAGPIRPPSPRCSSGYCLEVRPGQQVLVRSTTLAAPLLLALQRELLEREAWPLLRPELPGADEGFWAAARDRHLDGFPPSRWPRRRAPTPRIGIQAPANTRALAGVDAGADRARSRAPGSRCATPGCSGAGA